MNYISVIERYHENREFIHELMASIVTGIFDEKLFMQDQELAASMDWLNQNYPFVELIFILDEQGVQKSRNISKKSLLDEKNLFGKGVDRSQRPYFKKASVTDKVVVTEPYLSTTSHHLCISAAVRAKDKSGNMQGVLVVDIDLAHVIEFLMGDRKRQKAHPYFVGVYSIIVAGLFFVVGILLFSASKEIVTMFEHPVHDSMDLKPFGIIIFLTLALAIFDLGKTILEEEVLMHKDIFRHSSTRRTITRFIAAILIAVSIESLLLMFKSALDSPKYMDSAVAMMATSVGLLIGLGIYVYLGAKAEAMLKNNSRSTMAMGSENAESITSRNSTKNSQV